MSLSAEALRTELFQRLDQAQVHHDLYIALRSCVSKPGNVMKLNRNIRFFAGVESALFNSTVVVLYALHETRKDTVNLYRLLDALEPLTPPARLEEYRDRMARMKPLWRRVGVIRNEMVGHQSLELYADPAKTRAKLAIREVDELLAETRRMISDISSTEFDVGIAVMQGTRSSVDRLLSRING